MAVGRVGWMRWQADSHGGEEGDRILMGNTPEPKSRLTEKSTSSCAGRRARGHRVGRRLRLIRDMMR